MRAALASLSLVLASCVSPAPPPPPAAAPMCPPLPELPDAATETQRLNHYAVVIRLYAQCAGAQGN